LEALLARHGGGRSGLYGDFGDFAFAIQDFSRAFGGHGAGAVVIGSDLGHEILSVDGRVEDNDGNILAGGAIDDADHGGFVDGSQTDGVDALRDHGIHDLELAGEIGFGRRAVPDDFDAVFASGGDGAGMDGLPEQVRLTFRDNGDALACVAVAGGRKNDQKQQKTRVEVAF